ncbi:MAG TPA: mechanosensitive ion channel family protein [Gammaproteobacteria bacterium]|nr:mechanosensitive ion channel family protein [Gammaproteobacteria bacterium]
MDKLLEYYDQYEPLIIEWGIKLIIALVIVIIGRWIAMRIARFCERTIVKRGIVDNAAGHFIGTVIGITLTIIVLLTALQYLGMPMASIVAVLGAVALGVGLALKDTLANLAAGIVLIVTRPYRAGDYVIINDIDGVIEKIGMFQTVMRSVTNQEITVPNGDVVSNNIINYSIRPTRRIDFTFGIAYEADVAQARAIINQVIAADERLHKEPAPILWMDQLADSSVNLAAKVWTNTDGFWDVRSDFIESVKAGFDKAGIGIPYPHQVNVPYDSEPRENAAS